MNRAEKKTAADRAVLLLGLSLMAVVFVRTAWLCDDAYITLRVVDNLVNGHGLVWNVGERVQVYTHPLWLFVLSVPYFFTHEDFFTTLAVSMAISLLAAAILAARVARTPWTGLAGIAALVFSQAFVDYSTSGLENPLTHLLVVCFVWCCLREPWTARRLLAASTLAALAAVNRLDTFVLLAPALIVAWLQLRSVRGTLALAAGMLPLLAWEIFAIVYYGFPFPNTAYAKLGAGIPAHELVQQGWYYLYNCWQRDPLTIVAIIAGAFISLLRWNMRALALTVGMACYLGYVVRIGGDFMAGRFLTAPFVCAVAIGVGWTEQEWARLSEWLRASLIRAGRLTAGVAFLLTLLVIALLGLGNPLAPGQWEALLRRVGDPSRPEPLWARAQPTVFAGADYGKTFTGFKDGHGVGNERLFYFQESSVMRYRRDLVLPSGRYADEGRAYRNQSTFLTEVHGSVGFRGYFAGPKAFIIDYYALTDPLLARLPALYAPNWRIGHFARVVPPGYEATVAALQQQPPSFDCSVSMVAGPPWRWALWREMAQMIRGGYDGDGLKEPPGIPCKIENDQLASFYQQVALITRGPLWCRERWIAMWRMNTNQYRHRIDEDVYRFAGMRRVPLSEAQRPAAAGAAWGRAEGIYFSPRGVQVSLGDARHEPRVEIGLEAAGVYRVLFCLGHQILAQQDVGPGLNAQAGIAVYELELPDTVAVRGYDAIRIVPAKNATLYRLHHVRLGGATADAAQAVPAAL